MTEAQQFEFKKWYLVASGNEKSYTRYEIAEIAWQHQQQRIDELEKKLAEALKKIEVK